ncbi:hypothetical protein HMPREF9446_00122 [Bacteroides fluxus YIT 12057]|uniref:Uncharacterized protein n=1 Tax=Bacteroides fluxus YIT 12057 TaxID=763034 RepID=F3PN35_9BACE|nr:hypothetical protein HMPREF9446_00122 [Bacteroides fluxus YIT 12057]
MSVFFHISSFYDRTWPCQITRISCLQKYGNFRLAAVDEIL